MDNDENKCVMVKKRWAILIKDKKDKKGGILCRGGEISIEIRTNQHKTDSLEKLEYQR